jgi:hypothetical protein
MTTMTRCNKTNAIKFYRDGKRVFDFTINANIVTFSNNEIILI